MPTADKHVLLAIYDSLPDPVIILDEADSILSVNSAAVSAFGYAREEMIGRSREILLATAEIEAEDGITLFRRKNDSLFPGRTASRVVEAHDATPLRRIDFIHDISDVANLQAAQREAGRIFATALDAIHEGIAIFDAKERLILFNKTYRTLYGSNAQRLSLGMSMDEVADLAIGAVDSAPSAVGSKDTRDWVERLTTMIREASGETSIIRYGRGRWMRVQNSRASDGNIVALRVDVTDLQETQLALERQRLDYAALVENMPDFITRASPDLTFTFVNRSYAAFVGLPPEALIGQPMLDFVPKADRGIVEETLRSLTADHPVTPREQRRTLSDGTHRWILWSNIAVFEKNRLVEYVTVGRDITEIKAQQARIADQSAELERKNAALSQFTATVSHDMKAPIRHMSMFAQMMAEDVASKDYSEIGLYAEHLRESARRMEQLINSLLDYAQIADRIVTWHRVSARKVVDDVLYDLESLVEETAARITIGPLPDVRGDPELLKRLVQNLIGNAIKYRRKDEAPVIRIFGEERDGRVVLTFEDNGIGVDPRHAEKIFDVFQRLHRDEAVYPGTGIGLALARRIATSHEGTIALDKTYENGARFLVTLPPAL